MTEREKTIEEEIIEKDIKVEQLAREVFCKYSKDELSCEDCTFPIIQCVPRIWARKIINADYRKADEVRKETAKEYSNRIDEIVDWCISNKIGDDFDYEYFSNCLQNLKKEFGVSQLVGNVFKYRISWKIDNEKDS